MGARLRCSRSWCAMAWRTPPDDQSRPDTGPDLARIWPLIWPRISPLIWPPFWPPFWPDYSVGVRFGSASSRRFFGAVVRSSRRSLRGLRRRAMPTSQGMTARATRPPPSHGSHFCTSAAVVVSSAQNEIEEFKQKGLDIGTHRRRMVKEDLETKFKNADDPLRIVFVCAMWIAGFDVPSCSTIYLDKPMKNHTLMQTIARANRVWGEKKNGLIVDYVGVFGNSDLNKLSTYPARLK